MHKHTLKMFLFFLLGSCAAVFSQAPSSNDDSALRRAQALLKSTPLVDGHNDLPWVIRMDAKAPHDVEAYDLRQRTSGDTDLQRLREGQVGAQFWSVYIPGEIKAEGYAKTQLEQIDIAHRIIERYPEALELALTSEDVRRIFKKGKTASLLGMEGGHAIENSLGALRTYYRLGVRYMTLTHNVTLDWADAALDQPKHNGLTAFGKEVVAEMNRLGMLIDLSHVSPKVMSDVLAVSLAPVMYSHSSARALVDHSRNVPDSILAKLPQNGGVVMVTFIPAFVSREVYASGKSPWKHDSKIFRIRKNISACATLMRPNIPSPKRRCATLPIILSTCAKSRASTTLALAAIIGAAARCPKAWKTFRNSPICSPSLSAAAGATRI